MGLGNLAKINKLGFLQLYELWTRVSQRALNSKNVFLFIRQERTCNTSTRQRLAWKVTPIKKCIKRTHHQEFIQNRGNVMKELQTNQYKFWLNMKQKCIIWRILSWLWRWGLLFIPLYQRLHILPDFNGSLSNISVFNPTNSKKTLKNRKQKIYTDMKRFNLQSPSCVSPTLSQKI